MQGKYYNFDQDSLKYKQEKPDLKKRLSALSLFLLTTVVLAGIISLFTFNYFGSPKMDRLHEENSEIVAKYNALEKDFTRINTILNQLRIKDDSLYRVIAEVKPITNSIREAGFGGSEKYQGFEDMANSELVISKAKQVDILANKADIQLNSYDKVLSIINKKERKHAALPAISPIPKYDVGYISDYFGFRIHPIHKNRRYHWGVDLTAKIGTEIHSPGDGIVERINLNSSGYGRTLLINHGYGFKTLYGHLSRYNVVQGQRIKRGDVIAFVGNAGTSSGAHLHYEIITNGTKINPFNYFSLEMDSAEYNLIISNNKRPD